MGGGKSDRLASRQRVRSASEPRTGLSRDSIWHQPRVWLVAFALCVALVTFSVAFVDRPVALFSHAVIGRHPIFFDMQAPPNVLAPAAAVLVVGLGLSQMFGRVPRRAERVALTASVALIVATALKDHLKYIFGRAWPETFIHNNPSLIGDGTYGFFWFHGGPEFASFPSGHTTVAAAVATVVGCAYPRLKPLCWLLVAVVVIGLLGMDYHFVGDMIAGGCLGGAVGLCATSLSGTAMGQAR